MDIFGIAGYIGVVCFSLFQTVRMFYTRQVGGLSVWALWALGFGLLMLQVSMMLHGYPVYAIGNGITVLCAGLMLWGYYLYKEAA